MTLDKAFSFSELWYPYLTMGEGKKECLPHRTLVKPERTEGRNHSAQHWLLSMPPPTYRSASLCATGTPGQTPSELTKGALTPSRQRGNGCKARLHEGPETPVLCYD